MIFELSKQFRFDAAHTLNRSYGPERDSSRRIHGHSYRAEVTLRGPANQETGMVMDVGFFAEAMEIARIELEHRFLDEMPDLGPPTIENLCLWIWRQLAPNLPMLYCVTVHRDSTAERCRFYGPQGK